MHRFPGGAGVGSRGRGRRCSCEHLQKVWEGVAGGGSGPEPGTGSSVSHSEPRGRYFFAWLENAEADEIQLLPVLIVRVFANL